MDPLFSVGGAVGLVLIVTLSSLFARLRERAKSWGKVGLLTRCPQCLGFWAGVGLGLFVGGVPAAWAWLTVPLWGGLVSFLSYLAYVVIVALDEYGEMQAARRKEDEEWRSGDVA